MTASPWTTDRIGRLKTLWLEGVSAERIARDLANGITRSAVLGKVHRMGLSIGRVRVVDQPAVSQSTRTLARRASSASRGSTVPPLQGVARRPVLQTQEGGQATLLSVRRCECRWPLGDPLAAGFSLCGRKVARGAYCEPHAGVAYRTRRDTAQTLERLARLS